MKNTRKWIIALIIFIAFMWVCTIISKSIYVNRLPVVSVEKPTQKYIEHIVEADGIVTAYDFIPVHTIAGLRVEKVMVHEGDIVTTGDPLYKIDVDDLKEIVADKKTQISKLILNRSDKINNIELDKNINEVRLQWANEDLESEFKNTQLNVSVAEDNLKSAKRQVKRFKEKPIDKEDEDLQREYVSTLESLEEAVTSAQKTLEVAKLQQEQTLTKNARAIAEKIEPKSSDSTVELYNIDINSLNKEIEKYNKLIKNDGVVVSLVDGYINSINITSGSRTLDTADILIADSSQPYFFDCNITKEQGKFIGLHEEVDLKLNDRKVRGEKKVSVDVMSANVSGGYQIKCKLEDIETSPGVSGTFKKTVSDKLYDVVIPIEALNKDALVSYVYLLRTRDGILGTEYYVEKRLVTVADQNDRFVAIESGVSSQDLVITYYDKKISNGDVVKKGDL